MENMPKKEEERKKRRKEEREEGRKQASKQSLGFQISLQNLAFCYVIITSLFNSDTI